MDVNRRSFLHFVFLRNRSLLLFTTLLGIIYFTALRLLYPIPSFYADSYTWIGAAMTNQPVAFRPIGYSKLLIFFKFFSQTDVAIVAGQYLSNLFANLFLFFTCIWLFPLKKIFKTILYILLVFHPFYLLGSNYISSDAFFNSFTVVWFTLLIWIIYKSSPWIIFAHLAILAGLFVLRYNAIFFPVVTAFALATTKLPIWKKLSYITISCLMILGIVIVITNQTKSYTGTKTFSAFSGWQLANNALHIMQHDTIDRAKIKDKEVKAVLLYTLHFFDTTRQIFPHTGASAVFMWHINSPLKKYMKVYPGRKKEYFGTWNALGPVYSKFGQTLILQRPYSYIEHFVVPNARAYWFPDLEIYKEYMEHSDTIPQIAREFYNYKSNKTPAAHPIVYTIVCQPVQYVFTVANILFIVFAVYFLGSKKIREPSAIFKKSLLTFLLFYLCNFFFVVLLAPTVIRYHVGVFTILLPLLAILLQQTTNPHTYKNRSSCHENILVDS